MNGITPNNLKKEGWIEMGTIDTGCGNNTLWSKNINGEWYDLYFSDIDEDYIVVKHIAVVDSMKKLNEITS